MVDLHSHTTASDGSDSPVQLVERAASLGLKALAITDHDTFAGYEAAQPRAAQLGLELVCGIELSTKYDKKSVHLLGYFLQGEPAADFLTWLGDLQQKRRERNQRLAERLQSLQLDVRLEEVEAIGRTMAGRPHFARVLVEKGYVRTLQEAFERYLAEHGEAYVEREEVPLLEGIARMREAGGIPVMAHPVRLGRKDPREEEAWIADAANAGMLGLEVVHSDHSELMRKRYAALAAKYNLRPTGGSDFHGTFKADIDLGSGKNGNVAVPDEWLEQLRQIPIHA